MRLCALIVCEFRNNCASLCICMGMSHLRVEKPRLWDEERIWESRKGSEKRGRTFI
jgi:hypothetical protein